MTNGPSTTAAVAESPVAAGFGPKLRLLYLIAVAVIAFILRTPAGLGVLLLIQLALWKAYAIPVSEAWRLVRRLAPFVLMIAASVLFFPSESGGLRPAVWLTVLMTARIAAVVAASTVVNATTSPSEVVAAARGWLPEAVAVALASTMALFQGEGHHGGGHGHGRGDGSGGGRGGGRGRESVGFSDAIRRMREQGASGLVEQVEESLARAKAHAATVETTLPRERAEDIAVISGLAVLMLGTKVTKILPGVPFAPGFKLAIKVPLYILAASLTRLPYAATLSGFIVGVLSLLAGDGRYGLFELLKHVTPGIVIDLAGPLLRRGKVSTLGCVGLGMLAAVARSSTVLAVAAFVDGNRALYGFAALQGLSWLFFGALGGLATATLLKSLARLQAAARS